MCFQSENDPEIDGLFHVCDVCFFLFFHWENHDHHPEISGILDSRCILPIGSMHAIYGNIYQ